MTFLGIDPGLSGAVVRLSYPDMALEARRDFRELRDVVYAIRELAPGCRFAVLELVSAMPGQGVSSMFSFGRSTGVAMGALHAAEIPFVEVAPQRWQDFWREGVMWTEKEFNSRAIACQVFPEHTDLFARVKDHGTADAALLAAYGGEEYLVEGKLETSRAKNKKTVGGATVLVNPSGGTPQIRAS